MILVPKFNQRFSSDLPIKDANNSDAGEQVLWPFLRAKNIKKIDKLIISHADLDHSGGMVSLIKHITPKQILTPKVELLDSSNKEVLPCYAGQSWQWDEVKFVMLHPNTPLSNKKNDQSCVLHIKTKKHSILLTGDIGKQTEKQLIYSTKNDLQADLVVVPHHGSKKFI